MAAFHRVPQRTVAQRDVDHVATGFFHRLLDGHRHFARLAAAETDPALAITNHGERRKTELTAALHHLGDTVYAYQLLVKTVRTRLRIDIRHCATLKLEFQTTFPRGVSQRFYTTVIFEPGAVKRDRADARRLGPLGDQLADLGSRRRIARGAHVLAQFPVQRGCAGQHLVARTIDDLGVNVPRRAVDAQTGFAQSANLGARLSRAAQS